MKLRRFTLDHAPGVDPIPVGAVMTTVRNTYRIVESRPVESRVWPNRFLYFTEPMGPHNGNPPYGAYATFRYKRGEGPVDYYGPWPR